MSSSITSFPTIFFISSILIFSIANAKPSSQSLIQKVCSDTFQNYGSIIDEGLCVHILQSEPNLASNKYLYEYDLLVGLIESGISNSTNTRTYIESMMKRTSRNPGLKSALQTCKLSYDSVVDGFNGGLYDVKKKDYLWPSYILQVTSSDYVKNCESALASNKFEDEVISRGNKIVPIFALSACTIVDAFLDHHN